jgi:hypothetical protein
MPYVVHRESDDSTLQSGTTNADGEFSFVQNLSPGEWWWEVTDTTPTPDARRVGSSRSSGSGGAYSLAEIPMVLRALGNGVVSGYLGGLAVTYVPPTGLDLDVATGAAVALGFPAVVHTGFNYAITSTRDATNPKQCYLLLEFTGADGKVVIKDVCGTAAASPVLPALTLTEATYQLPLASFRLPNTGSANLTQVSDLRTYANQRTTLVTATVRRVDLVTPLTTTSTTGVALTGLTTTVTLLSGVVYDLEVTAAVLLKVTAGQAVSIAPYLNGTSNVAEYLGTNVSADYVLVSNTHTLLGVAGTGATVDCGLLWKVSGGTGSALTGWLHVLATPRS